MVSHRTTEPASMSDGHAGTGESPAYATRSYEEALALRPSLDAGLAAAFGGIPPADDVRVTVHSARAEDGHEIELRLHERMETPARGSAVVYVHGGSMVAGRLDDYERLVNHYVHHTGVPFLSVGYRLAPEHQGTVPAADAFAGVRWLFENARRLDVDRARIAVMGDSAGGGIGAGAVLLAREQGLRPAAQILIYPTLDDRTVIPDPTLTEHVVWSYAGNRTAWTALLGTARGTDSVPAAAAPARTTDFAGLPPTYLEVGQLDILRDEAVAYAQALYRAGVPCELHVRPSAVHGFDWIDPAAEIARQAMRDRVRVIGSL
ncbi:acetyl esterase/lipase [Actinoalloteichus hoggarensis]|uniref:Carboxylesterase NlhH n=1 Tax=Actinoalloteichus hoggarensis TaxID=1470176 RepID=A0A221VYP4_9PSEU|nr:alpha/beta hydrolase [Actinoalloteichus hoggarensis]ASO18650.1 Carboxylesterase NlhH [Actinoalloteichus hoggarensis]MBB5922019.1 acetyl esterase/lipase [Actinoalloteichus hoggarensis]